MVDGNSVAKVYRRQSPVARLLGMRPDPKLEVSVFLEVEMEEVGKELEFTLEDADRLSEEIRYLTPRYRSMVTALAAAAYRRNGAGEDAGKGVVDVGAPGASPTPVVGAPGAPPNPVVPDGAATGAGDDGAEVLMTLEDGDDLPPIGEVIRHGYAAGKRLGLAGPVEEEDEDPEDAGKIGGRLEATKIGSRIVVKRRRRPNEL